MSWRFAAAGLVLPKKEHKSMIQFLKTAITRGPDPLRTRPASFCTVWPRKTLSTPRVELVTALPTRAVPIATKSYVQAARNGPSLSPCVAKAEMSTADRLGSREGSSRAGPPQGRGVSR